MFNFYKYILNA